RLTRMCTTGDDSGSHYSPSPPTPGSPSAPLREGLRWPFCPYRLRIDLADFTRIEPDRVALRAVVDFDISIKKRNHRSSRDRGENGFLPVGRNSFSLGRPDLRVTQ